MATTSPPPEIDDPPTRQIEPVEDHQVIEEFWEPDTGATTAEYAITTLAACGSPLLVVVLKSDIKELITVISSALGLGS